MSEQNSAKPEQNEQNESPRPERADRARAKTPSEPAAVNPDDSGVVRRNINVRTTPHEQRRISNNVRAGIEPLDSRIAKEGIGTGTDKVIKRVADEGVEWRDLAEEIAEPFREALIKLTGQARGEYDRYVGEFAPLIAQYAVLAANGDQIAEMNIRHLTAQGIMRAATLGVELHQSLELALQQTIMTVLSLATAMARKSAA